ncbi:MAG TPA: hypothetical protein VGB08_03665 [Allosphingosinicella sp.]
MKKLVMTAAALTLGTSALAWAPAEEAHLAALELARTDWSAEKSPLAFSAFDKGAMKAESAALEASWSPGKGDELGMKSLAKWSGDANLQTAGSSEAKVSTDGGMTFADSDIKAKDAVDDIESASAETGAKVSTDGGMTFAEADIKSKDDVGGIQTASAGSVDTAAAKDGTASGMGGPLETAMGWPACEPGRGDDRCIQLYERGVLPALAAWKGADENVAMGGPFEQASAGAKPAPTEGQATDSHAGHDMSADAGAKTETPDSPPVGDAADDPAKGTPATTTPGAIGGPIEQRSGYPPCRPGRGDDRCIQLYERGVTGRQN